MKPIQNASVSRGLVAQFGLRGRSIFALDEVVVPTRDVGDFNGASPFEDRILAADSVYLAAQGVGTYTGVIITPGVGTIAVIHHLRFVNTVGSGIVKVKVFRPADSAAVTVVVTSPAAQLNGVMGPTGLAPQAPITSRTFHHTNTTLGADIESVYSIINGADVTLDFPRGVVLDGDDPAGPISLVAQLDVANQMSPRFGFYATIYRRP